MVHRKARGRAPICGFNELWKCFKLKSKAGQSLPMLARFGHSLDFFQRAGRAPQKAREKAFLPTAHFMASVPELAKVSAPASQFLHDRTRCSAMT